MTYATHFPLKFTNLIFWNQLDMYECKCMNELYFWLHRICQFLLEYFDFNTTSEPRQHRHKIVLSRSWLLKRLLTECPQSTQETGDSTLTVFIKQHTLVHKTKHYGKPVYLNYGTCHGLQSRQYQYGMMAVLTIFGYMWVFS